MIILNYPTGNFILHPHGYLELNKGRNYFLTRNVAKLEYSFCTLWKPFGGTWLGYCTSQIALEGKVRYNTDNSFNCIAYEFFTHAEIRPSERMRKYLDSLRERYESSSNL